MTAQLSDGLLIDGTDYTICAMEYPDNLFDPKKAGLDPKPAGSGCWRGYACNYAVNEGKLILKTLYYFSDEYPELNGKKAQRSRILGMHEYDAVNIPIDYSGKLLIGDKFMRSHYQHMGFQSPSAYETLHELTFDKGTLTYYRDLSSSVSERRQSAEGSKSLSVKSRPNPKDMRGIDEYISHRFSQSYEDRVRQDAGLMDQGSCWLPYCTRNVPEGRLFFIEPLSSDTAGPVYGLERSNASNPMALDTIRRQVGCDEVVFLTARHNDKVTGFISMDFNEDDENCGQIRRILVNEKLRRQGMGTTLVKGLVAYGWQKGIETITVDIEECDDALCTFFQQLGFSHEGQDFVLKVPKPMDLST